MLPPVSAARLRSARPSRAVALFLAVAVWGSAGCSAFAPKPPRFRASILTTLPEFSTDASTAGRDAGFSARIGSQVAWLFGDTFPNDDIMLSATAAWSHADDPTRLTEAMGTDAVPFELYEYSQSEMAYNLAHAEPPACCEEYATCPNDDPYCACEEGTDCGARIALWPGAIVARDARTLVGFYEKVKVGAGPWDFDVVGVGTATLELGRTRAVRLSDVDGEPSLVFARGEPKFLHGLRVEHDDVSWVYAYGETEPRDCGVDVYVARVPLEHIGDRSAYRFFDGRGWGASLAEARPIMAAVPSGIGSVAWNDYLGAYVSGTIGACTDGGQFLMRSARRPEGPWSRPEVVDLSDVGADGQAYAGLVHASLGRGQRIVISFYQPLVRDDRALGRVHLVEIELHRRSVSHRGHHRRY